LLLALVDMPSNEMLWQSTWEALLICTNNCILFLYDNCWLLVSTRHFCSDLQHL